MNKKTWIVIAIAAILIVLALVLFDGNKKPAEQENTAAPAATASAETTAAEPAKEEATPTAEPEPTPTEEPFVPLEVEDEFVVDLGEDDGLEGAFG